MGYTPTVYPSRRGESLKDLQDRADLFVETWTSRVEELYPEARAVVIFAHAASVIALGRAVSSTPRSQIPVPPFTFHFHIMNIGKGFKEGYLTGLPMGVSMVEGRG